MLVACRCRIELCESVVGEERAETVADEHDLTAERSLRGTLDTLHKLLVDFVAVRDEFAQVLSVLDRVGRGEERQRVEGQALVHREHGRRGFGEIVRVVEDVVERAGLLVNNW